MDVTERLLEYLSRAAGDRSIAPTRFQREIAKHSARAGQTIMNSLDKLIERRLQEHMPRVLLAERREVLLKQLRLRFGELSDEQVAVVGAAGMDDLEGCLERVLTADSVSAVFGEQD